ncbi:MAG: hypothetical protein KDC24_07610 [Saprospiraceae bacterium]|nr:hypothetical protein [Saprospiraceae bacterium]
MSNEGYFPTSLSFECLGNMIYEIEKLRKRQIEELYASLGGKFSFLERLKRGGIGSPLLYYKRGWEQIDLLNNNSTDTIRVNIEELKGGYFFRFTDRTRTYFAPVLKNEILSVSFLPEDESAHLIFHFNNKPSLTTWVHKSRWEEISLYLKNGSIGQKLEGHTG